ncbi:MAG: (d)CMP kinase [Pseudomonadota bacterium]
MIIAVDGPVAAGKGTLARRLAAELQLAHLDTGAIYRAVGAKLLAAGGDPQDRLQALEVARRLTAEDLDRTDLRDEAVGQAASMVAVIPEVREALLHFQRNFARRPPEGFKGAVLDGRDIGTVVCPDADIKIFVTAGVEARADRRHKELIARGEESIYARVLQNLKERDRRDSERETAPLMPARDAVLLDSSELGIDAAFEVAMSIVGRWQKAKNAP